MKIALIHFRVGETDGVSLEMDKWKRVLQELGHEVMYISGRSVLSDVRVISEIAYNDPLDLKLAAECYDILIDYNCESLESKIYTQANIVKEKFIEIINEEKLDYLVPNNIFALGKSLPIAIGLFMAVKETNVKVVNHHHDFYWERVKYSYPTCEFIKNISNNLFPPKHINMKHVVINSHARHDLLTKKGIESIVVPNVFDFDAPFWEIDEYNVDFKVEFGLDENDIVFLQATRVTNRKGIELAIDTIAELNKYKAKLVGKSIYDGRVVTKDTNFTLLIVGLHEGNNNYEERLMKYAILKNVKMIMEPSKIGHSRKETIKGKIYSLWDAYAHVDIITYPSIYEGWGNQFLEGLFAKIPMLVYEYSVFEEDIKQNNFYYASLGNSYSIRKEDGLVYVSKEEIKKAAKQLLTYLFDLEKRNICVEQNFLKGKEFYSLNTLKELLKPLFEN